MIVPQHVIVVDPDATRRNAVARIFRGNAKRAVRCESFEKLQSQWSDASVVMIHDDEDALPDIFRLLFDHGGSIPVVVYASDPEPSRIVDVISMGATDYLKWPIPAGVLRSRLDRMIGRTRTLGDLRMRSIQSQLLVGSLSTREREVLFLLARGHSNKTMARALEISPRTVENHRKNMMGKLGTETVGGAISVAIYSELASQTTETGDGPFDPLVPQR